MHDGSASTSATHFVLNECSAPSVKTNRLAQHPAATVRLFLPLSSSVSQGVGARKHHHAFNLCFCTSATAIQPIYNCPPLEPRAFAVNSPGRPLSRFSKSGGRNTNLASPHSTRSCLCAWPFIPSPLTTTTSFHRIAIAHHLNHYYPIHLIAYRVRSIAVEQSWRRRASCITHMVDPQ